MSKYFDKSLHYLGNKNKLQFVLNIGAMDGVMFDEMSGYTHMYNAKGLYVEPILYLFERLKNNFGDSNLFENSAISDYNGEIEMLTIDREAIDNKAVHECFYGMSAVFPPKNGLASEGDKLTVETYGKVVKVPCITFDRLIEKHSITSVDVIKIDAEGHDYHIFKQIDLEKLRPKVVRIEWINLTETEQNNILEKFKKHDYKIEISGQDIIGITKELYNDVFSVGSHDILVTNNTTVTTVKSSTGVTLVTGLWDIKRDSLSQGWSRSFDHYLEKFEQLLDVKENMIIFGDRDIEPLIWKKRKPSNTHFILRDQSWFTNNSYYELIQKIRTNPEWLQQAGWLEGSTQARLEMYNPLVMSKMFLLNDARLMDKFNSTHLYWIDAGITNTVHPGYFTHDHVIDKIEKTNNNFTFICFPYEANTEVHGFSYNELCKLAKAKTNKVARGGFFGGPVSSFSDVNTIYYNLLVNTLSKGLMGTEESLFTLMIYQHPELFEYAEIESNGLIGTYFENVKNNSVVLKREKANNSIKSGKTFTDKSALYVITFNSPKQFATLLKSMDLYDKNILAKTTKFLLDNSTDTSTFEEYSNLCKEHGFDHIKKDNLGICGGRQFIAEHFAKTDFEYMMFFEDDMFFYPHQGKVCKNGFNRYVEDFYNTIMKIMAYENYDFLKFSFTEFYGNNSLQWSWYNVPQCKREEYWPEYSKLPEQGIDPNSPKTLFNHIKSINGVPYVDGEVYYCNWPQIVSKEGNKKMFLDTNWAHPFEQTWMSHIYQLTVENKIHPGLLLLSPIEHDRFDHYQASQRKES